MTSRTSSNIVILHGPAGSGKGTVAKELVKLDYYLIGAGDEIRDYIKSANIDDDKAIRMQNKLDQGLHVDTTDLLSIVEQKLLDLKGFKVLGDGLVREKDQALWLHAYATLYQESVTFINLTIEYDVIAQRLKNRYFIPSNPFPYSSYQAAFVNCKNGEVPYTRSDDFSEAIKSRFDQHTNKLSGIKEVCRSSKYINFYDINANQSPDNVLNDIKFYI